MVDRGRPSGVELAQEELEDDMARLEAWGRAHPDRYADIWFQQSRHRPQRRSVRMCIGVTGDVADVEDELRSLVDHPQWLRVVRKRWTLSELRAVQDEICEELMKGGGPVTMCGIEAKTNIVNVGISTRDAELTNQILDRWGADRVHVEQGVNVIPVAARPATPSPRRSQSPVGEKWETRTRGDE